MPPTVAITSLTNPRVKQVVKLREHRERRRTGLFIAEGLREVTRAAAAGLRMRELWLCPELLGATRVDIEADAVFEVPTAVLRKMAYVRVRAMSCIIAGPFGSSMGMLFVSLLFLSSTP